MTGELESVSKQLEVVDREIHDLERNLEDARKRKKDLQNQRAKIEQRIKENEAKPIAPAPAPVSLTGPPGETPEQLQARIAELQKQIEIQKKAAMASRSADPSPSNPPPATSSAPAEAAPDSPTKEKKNWGLFGRGARKKEDPSPGVEEPGAAPLSPSPARDPPAGPSPQPNSDQPPASPSKTKSVWERPGWATNMDIVDDRAVLSDPIKENALKEQTKEYSRKVVAKDLNIQKGKFVKPTTKKVEPRLTWIVLRINTTGVPGKVVMHLYGKDVHNLVDHFVDLKDKSVVVGGPNKACLTVECDPPLYITISGSQGLDTKAGVYGVVQEGKEIVDKVVNEGAAAKLTIKQAHIFPVKRAK